MSSKENYFPDGTSIDTINDILYTDYGFLGANSTAEDNVNQSNGISNSEHEEPLEPPF